MKGNKKGFTLLEILIVIAILGILALMLMGNFFTSLKRGRDARRKGDLAAVAKAVELYYQDNNRYPVPVPLNSDTTGRIIGCGSGASAVACEWGEPFVRTINTRDILYMAQLPDDPTADRNYYYRSNGFAYQIYSMLEQEEDPEYVAGGYAGTSCDVNTTPCTYGISSVNTTPDAATLPTL